MGIYGDMLLVFPEQFRTFTAYEMNALINGGFEKVEGSEKDIQGILQNTKGNAIAEQGGNLVNKSVFELWTSSTNLDGLFIDIDGKPFRLIDSNNWVLEGGFKRYTLEMVGGNNATESDDTAWNLGNDSFS
jgi:hypothetical protein